MRRVVYSDVAGKEGHTINNEREGKVGMMVGLSPQEKKIRCTAKENLIQRDGRCNKQAVAGECCADSRVCLLALGVVPAPLALVLGRACTRLLSGRV